MDRSRFDALTRLLAQDVSRRTVLKAFLGLGSVAGAGADAKAARRGYPGPPVPTILAGCRAMCLGDCCDGDCTLNGHCCPAGNTVCGYECCPNGQAVCCGDHCCYGDCIDGTCCAHGQTYCTQTGCCDHACTDGGTTCCAPHDTCGHTCCAGGHCCQKDDLTFACTQIGRCCGSLSCGGGRCDSEGFCH